jgi:cysteinyl-tRNA synthetase
VIRFFNTLGRSLEEFQPISPGVVKMYTCGPTLWNYPHIGNYRTFVFEDFLRRFLEYRGYAVEQIMNLTDVDDRIIKIAREQDLADFRQFTEKFASEFFDDLQFLNVEQAHRYPRASDHIPEMTAIIARLIETGHAYRGDDGSIYFKISTFPSYGKLSGLVLSELKAGARVKVDDYGKESAQDFALWKAWDPDDGRIFWETTLGKGRPGWHIECSAMSMKYLGEHFDIHTGGVDNIFPHHENEIAQSESYTGKKFVNYWLHSEFLLINNEKMAKRIGNVITIKDLRDSGASGAALRLLFLSAHYRAQQNFTEQSLAQASASLDRLNEFTSRLRSLTTSPTSQAAEIDKIRKILENTRAEYVGALENDLDTPSAIATIFELATKMNTLLDSRTCDQSGASLVLDFMLNDFDRVFGVLDRERAALDLPEQARELLSRREEARRLRKWEEADALREELLTFGVKVEDTPQGQKWKLVRRVEI